MPNLGMFGPLRVPSNHQVSQNPPAETRPGCIPWIWYRGGPMPRPYALVVSEKHVIVPKSPETTVDVES